MVMVPVDTYREADWEEMALRSGLLLIMVCALLTSAWGLADGGLSAGGDAMAEYGVVGVADGGPVGGFAFAGLLRDEAKAASASFSVSR